MGGDNLFRVLIATAKAKVTPFVTKVKLWTSWNFIRTRLISSIRDFFISLLDVKPRHKKDYYEVFGWLVSKRLAVAVVVAVGVFSLYYLFSVQSVLFSVETEGIKTYSYNSLMLRFTKGKVRIRGASGYLAYEGEVADGSVTGYGTLYNPDGVVVYQGSFDRNKYQGKGTRYYDDGTMMYVGDFHQNLFDGNGKLYRPNGSLEYEGEFSRGQKEGQGKLYDSGSNLIYTGGFGQDELLYSDLLGKKISEIPSIYEGRRTLYESSRDFVVVLEDIQAMYLGKEEENTLDGERVVERVIVLKDFFGSGGHALTAIEELRSFFGEEDYEGNSQVNLPEAVALNRMTSAEGSFRKKAEIELSAEFDDYYLVEGFDETCTVYLYSFHKENLIYHFICQDKEDTFLFYSIEKADGGDE